MKHLYYSIIIVFIVYACNQASNKTKEKLYSELKNEVTLIDTVNVGKELNLTYQHFDSANVPATAKQKIKSRIIPLAVKNKEGFENVHRMAFSPVSSTVPLTPEIIKLSPCVSFVKHPKPIKAGDFKSTGLANENIMYLNEEQNLPGSSVKDMLFDNKGCLWMGVGNALTKFDGYNFYTYNLKNGLPIAGVNKLLMAKDSTLWIAAKGGLINFNGNKFTIYNKQCGLPSNDITDIAVDKQNNIWFIIRDVGIAKLNNNSLKFYKDNEINNFRNAVKIVFDKYNKLIVCNWGGGPSLLENETVLRKFRREDSYYLPGKYAGFGSDVTTSVYVNKNNEVYYGCYTTGVSLVKKDSSINYKPKTGVSYFLISDIYEDNKGKMWFCTGEGGLTCLDKDGFTHYTTKQGLTSNKINCVIEDAQQNIWIGTEDGGLNRIKPNSFRHYSSIDGLTDKPISSLYVNKNDVLLAGTWGAGIYAFNGTYFANIGGSNGPPNHIILSMAEDDKSNIYFGVHQGGLQKFTPNKNDSSGYDSIIKVSSINNFENIFTSALHFSNNKLWVGDFEQPLIRYNFNSFDKFSDKTGLLMHYIGSISSDVKNNIWLAYFGAGISKINGNKITHYSKTTGLPNNNATLVYVDSKQNLWVGTTAGICKYDGKSFTTFDNNDGLTNNSIHSVIEDDKHRIWVGTAKGLNVLYPNNKLKKGYGIDYFLLQDGLKTNYFYPRAVAKDKKNNLWWGSTKGIIKLNLNDYDIKRTSPNCYIQQIGLMDEHINFSELKDSIDNSANYYNVDSSYNYNSIKFTNLAPFNNLPLNLNLPYNLNTINFYFFAFNGHSPHRIKYRYRLLGLNNNWIYVNYPEAKFSNIDAGNYTFEAQAKLEGENWGTSCSYAFKVSPPFWKTIWFLILCISVLIYLIVLIFRFRNKQLIERQKQLETTVKERTFEIENQKHLIEEKQKEIVDSINYAKRIQYTLLAHEDFLKENIPNHFILFNPKDIVSGDFYWATKKENRFYLAVCDSTGHGVPGAFMSLLNIGFLTEAINEKGIEKPNEVFEFVRKRLIENISKEGQKDGFDGILICVDQTTNEITYAAANNNPVIINDVGFEEKDGDRMPVGVGEKKDNFKLFHINLNKNETLYLYTDGYPDQFGGPKGKKFKYKQLNTLLLNISSKPLAEQKEILNTCFNNWRGELEQVDDVCVIGIQIGR